MPYVLPEYRVTRQRADPGRIPYGHNASLPGLTGEFINNNFVLPTSTLPGGRAGLAGYFVNGTWVTPPFETPGLGAFEPGAFVTKYKWPLLAALGGLFLLGGKRARRRTV